MITPEEIAAQADRLLAEGPNLQALGIERRLQALAQAAALLADPSSDLGGQARTDLPASTGLSRQMVDWALRTTLAPITPEALEAFLQTFLPAASAASAPGLQPVPPRLATLILAGNVFTAAVRPVLLALLAGAPVLCKSSSRSDRFPALFAAALHQADPAVAAALAVLAFPGGTTALEDPLLARSDVVLAYGSDATVQTLRQRLPAHVRLLAHGHGVGAAYVPATVLNDPDQSAQAAARLALDVAAYDQKGCLSPQAVWVEGGRDWGMGRRFAQKVQEGLERWHHHLPLGPLTDETAAAQSQWKGVLQATADLFLGEGGNVAWAQNPAVPAEGGLPWGPGHRNLLVLPCDGPEDLVRHLTPLGTHLKALGAAGGPEALHRLAEALPPPLCPRLTPLGQMQTPPLATPDDGAPPFEGLLRWRHVVA
jgi:Acyl-CoA reductase (LuxC)